MTCTYVKLYHRLEIVENTSAQIKNCTILLMTNLFERNPLLLSRESVVRPFPTVSRVTVMDLGSNNWKIADWKAGADLELADGRFGNTGHFYNWHLRNKSRQMEISGLPPFKIIDGTIIDDFMNTVRAFRQNTGPPDMYVLTGLINSLAVFGENGKTIVMLDDPSARTELTSNQKAVISAVLPDPYVFEREGLKIASSLMKVLFLRNHPEAIRALFGDAATFEKLRFSSLRGLLTEKLIREHDREFRLSNLVPSGGDTRAFAGGNVGIDGNRMGVLFRRLGIHDRQINLLRNPMVVHAYRDQYRVENQVRVYNVQDFEANAWMISRFIGKEHFQDADFIELDSVLKIIRRKKSPAQPVVGLKTLPGLEEILEYSTQRNGANAINNICKFLADQHGHLHGFWQEDLYKAIRDISAVCLQNSEISRYFYYPDKGLYGTLIERKKEDDIVIIDPQTDLSKKYDIQQIKEMIAVVIRGVAYNVRKKQEEITQVRSDAPVSSHFLYGGLSTYDPNSSKMIAQCLSGKVQILKLPHAGQSAFLKAMYEMGVGQAGEYRVETEEIKHDFKRDEEYEIWSEMMGKVQG